MDSKRKADGKDSEEFSKKLKISKFRTEERAPPKKGHEHKLSYQEKSMKKINFQRGKHQDSTQSSFNKKPKHKNEDISNRKFEKQTRKRRLDTDELDGIIGKRANLFEVPEQETKKKRWFE